MLDVASPKDGTEKIYKPQKNKTKNLRVFSVFEDLLNLDSNCFKILFLPIFTSD